MSSGVFEPVCVGCGKSLGFMDVGELEALEDCSNGSGCLCFDCDPESAATTPSIFWQWREGDRFTIGDEVLDLEWNVSGYPVLVQSHAHERERARVLSSYTNLNRTQEDEVVEARYFDADYKLVGVWKPKNQSLLKNGVETVLCPECKGFGHWIGKDAEIHCATCNGWGLVATAIVIPAWILGLGVGNV